MKLFLKLASILTFSAPVLGRWTDGSVVNDGPLMVVYVDDWAGWLRQYFVSDTEKNVLSRNIPVRNWVLNYAFLAWNPVDCRIAPVDHEIEFSKGDPGLYASTPTWWSPGATTYTSGTIPAILSLKQKYPHIKILPSIGGWSRSHTFHQCLIDKPNVMVQSALDVVNSYGFDGIDFDWEYPNCDAPGATCGCQGEDTCSESPNVAGPGDWDRYKSFLTTLREAFNALEDKMEKRLYITAALGVNPKLLDGGNDVWTIGTPLEWICENDAFDWVNLMTYDFYGPWAAKTGPLSPLYATPDDVCNEGETQMSIEDSLNRILSRCSKPEKLTLGMPSYGKIWKNVPRGDGAVPGLWQSATGSPFGGKGTWETGTVSVWDIKQNYESSPNCEATFDDLSKTATVYCKNNPTEPSEKNIFITYDNGEAWKAKMAFARAKGMAGGIIWAASDLGKDAPQNAEELFGGALEGWYGEPKDIDPPGSNGRTQFVNPKPFANFPCPLPYGANVKTTSEIPNSCYSNNLDTSLYATQDSWQMPSTNSEIDNIGDDVLMIHPIGGDENPTVIPRTTPKPTKRITTRGRATPKPTSADTTKSSSRWNGGTIINDGPLMVVYVDDWAGWAREYFVSDTEKNVLSRNIPVRNWVLNYAFLAWNPEDCHIAPVDHQIEFSKGDPGLYSSTPTWWSPGSTTYTSGTIPAFMSLKQKYPYIKLLPSIGGWSRSHTFHQCLIDKPDVMIQSALDLVNSYGFDGIDFDWEYPNCDAPGATCGCQGEDTCLKTSNVAGEGDWERYKSFLTTLREAFNDLENKMQKKLYITAALGVNPKLLDGNNDIWTVGTPIEWICETDAFDWVNLMTYDFYGPWAAKTGPLSPLYATPDDVCNEGDNQMSVEDSLNRILSRCSKPEKLTLGMPSYGKIWKNVPRGDGTVPGLWQSATGSPFGGNGTWEVGTVSVWDINKNYVNSPNCESTFDDYSKTATIYCEKHPMGQEKNIFITYDNGEAWKEKMAFARSKGMAGGIVWAASDLGKDAPQNAEELFSGALEGWYGEPKNVDPPHSNGPTEFVNPKPWANFPCPLPYGADVNSAEEIPNSCYASNADSSLYASRKTWQMPKSSSKIDVVGKDVIMIHPLDDNSPTDLPETTEAPATHRTHRTTARTVPKTTRGTTTMKKPTTSTKTSKRLTTTKPATKSTTKPTTKKTSTVSKAPQHLSTRPITRATSKSRTSTMNADSTAAPVDPVVAGCAEIMNWEGQVDGWVSQCQSLCSYYIGTAWCGENSSTDADALAQCVYTQAAYCKRP